MQDSIRAVSWTDAGIALLDQRQLPHRAEILVLNTVREVAEAIQRMVVRGAPAIGITAAYAVVLAARGRYAADASRWKHAVAADLALLAGARPTAVNLAWALQRMAALIAQLEGDPGPPLLAEARRIHAEDIAANHRMGELGAAVIESPCEVLTHCNAGALATGGFGTALGVIRSAFTAGKIRCVYADETRPWLQGARLTAWELLQDHIPVKLIADGAATYAMRQGKVRWVIVGADRIAANGDVANKIGTYGLAVSARYHGVGFMVVAPISTLDLGIAHGSHIPIEERGADELVCLGERRVAAAGAGAWNPVFDVTPAELIDVIVTERGVVRAPNREKLAALIATETPPNRA
nr:S-methyl-5-thioribose-1-phosphate isomerase [Gammaproteobacteria bacterium]